MDAMGMEVAINVLVVLWPFLVIPILLCREDCVSMKDDRWGFLSAGFDELGISPDDKPSPVNCPRPHHDTSTPTPKELTIRPGISHPFDHVQGLLL
jgi:hypothetical protein